MSDPSEVPWSDNPYAPKIPRWLYTVEKIYFAGSVIGAVFYGIVIVLFFQCMCALLDPVNRTSARGGIKWGFVAHTVAMFVLVTIYVGITLNTQSISFIDNRDFPGTTTGVAIPPGPVGYQWSIHYKAVTLVPSSILVILNLLADGLLLYRCYVVYAMSYWAIAFPCVMYIACISTSVWFIYRTAHQETTLTLDASVRSGAPYFSIAFSFNIFITLMIIIRLLLHRRNIRNAMGATTNAGGLYKAIITIIVESSALFVVGCILFLGPWAAKSFYQYIFLQLVTQIQVIAPFLITLRVADRRALEGNTIYPGTVGSIHFGSGGKATGSGEAASSGVPVRSVDAVELGVEIEATIDLRHGRDSGSDGSSKT